MQKRTFLILAIILLIFKFSSAQQNHIVILEKNNWIQEYKVSNNFPNDWVKSKWEEGYNIRTVSFKNNEWFVSVVKYKSKANILN